MRKTDPIDGEEGVAYLVVPPSASAHDGDLGGQRPTLHLWRHELYTYTEEIVPHSPDTVLRIQHP